MFLLLSLTLQLRGEGRVQTFVFDRRQVFIGSLNLDPRSVIHNTELGSFSPRQSLPG